MYVICGTYVGVKVHAWFIQNEIRRRWGGAKCRDWEMRNKKEEERKEKESADRKTDV